MGGNLTMINHNFKLNWTKMLNFNENVDIWSEATEFDEKLRIPLTPIQIDASLLYYLFKELYPKFINDQKHIVDVIISEEQDSLQSVFLYETKEPGIHEPFQKLSNDVIIFQKKDLDDIEEFYNKLQMIILEQENVRISTLRLFNAKIIDLINGVCVDIDNISIREFLNRNLKFLQTIFEEELFHIYPEPNLYRFLKDCFSLLKGISLENLIPILDTIVPIFNTALIIRAGELDLIFTIEKSPAASGESEVTLAIQRLDDLDIAPQNDKNIYWLMGQVKQTLKTDNVYFTYLSPLITLLSDLVDLRIPFQRENITLFFQKALYGYRSFEKNWYMYPRPKAYNSLLRFLLRLLGINLNLRKISHWTLPEILFNVFNSYFGLHSKILIIVTDLENLNSLKPKEDDYLRIAFRNAFLLEVENGSLINLESVEREHIISNTEFNSLKSIRNQASKRFGYLSAVINTDLYFIKTISKNFLFELSKFKPLKKIKAFRAFKKDYYFNLYPELPPFKLLKEKGMFWLFRSLLPVFIDKHEF